MRRADPPPKLTARQVLDALRKERHLPNQWVYVEEVRAGTGYGTTTWNDGALKFTRGRGADAVEQRLDAWALQLWNPGAIIAYEVKVSRSDFLHEIRDPEKRAFAMMVSSEFYFVTPVRLVDVAEVPEDCGLIEVYEDGRVRTKKKAPSRPCMAPPTWNFVGSLMRRMRRTMYEQGPGHQGQCGGIGRHERIPYETHDGRTRSYPEWRSFRNTAEAWCAAESGHAGDCRIRSAADTHTAVEV